MASRPVQAAIQASRRRVASVRKTAGRSPHSSVASVVWAIPSARNPSRRCANCRRRSKTSCAPPRTHRGQGAAHATRHRRTVPRSPGHHLIRAAANSRLLRPGEWSARCDPSWQPGAWCSRSDVQPWSPPLPLCPERLDAWYWPERRFSGQLPVEEFVDFDPNAKRPPG